MSHVEKSIDVNVPLSTAYNQWTQFQEFPQFMEGVKEVQQLDDNRLHWRAHIGGKDVEWDAVIIEQIPDHRIAWRNTTGAENAGLVTFERLAGDITRVNLQMDYDTDGFLEAIGDRLGFVTRRVEGDLERFKQFIEIRGQETGAWRGEISGETSRLAGADTQPAGGAPPETSGADYAGREFAGPSAEGVNPTAGNFTGLTAQGAPVVTPEARSTGAALDGVPDAFAGTGLSTTAQALDDPAAEVEPLPRRREESRSAGASRDKTEYPPSSTPSRTDRSI